MVHSYKFEASKYIAIFLILLFIVQAGLSKEWSLDEYHKIHYHPSGTKERQDHVNIHSHLPTKDQSNKAVEDQDYWFADGQAELQAQLQKTFELRQAKNIILFIGDGTSVSTMTAARLLKGQRSGNYERESNTWDTFPYTGLIKTYNTDEQVTDSAASSTAYSTGSKANQGTIGVDSNVLLRDCDAMNFNGYHTQSVLRDFQLANKATGIVTTTRVTHASPAGNFAHTAERHWENDDDINDEEGDPVKCDDIAEQLVYGATGSGINVILGGGRKKFLPKDAEDPEGEDGGRRDDDVDLIQEWLNQKQLAGNAVYMWSKQELQAANLDNIDYLLGLFDYSHLDYYVDNSDNNPTLQEMVISALNILQKDPEGFFLFVEGGLIDKAHHENEHRSAIEEAFQFELAVQRAVEMTSENDTLILVTADHAQPLVLNGYSGRNSDVLGLADTLADFDNQSYSILDYGNGPGYRDQKDNLRPDAAEEDWTNPHYMGASAVPNIESYHSGEDVAIFARGPHSHLFTGVHENSYIPHAMRYAACVGNGLQFCSSK